MIQDRFNKEGFSVGPDGKPDGLVYVGPPMGLPEPDMVAHPDPNSNRVVYARCGEAASITNDKGQTGVFVAGTLRLDR